MSWRTRSITATAISLALGGTASAQQAGQSEQQTGRFESFQSSERGQRATQDWERLDRDRNQRLDQREAEADAELIAAWADVDISRDGNVDATEYYLFAAQREIGQLEGRSGQPQARRDQRQGQGSQAGPQRSEQSSAQQRAGQADRASQRAQEQAQVQAEALVRQAAQLAEAARRQAAQAEELARQAEQQARQAAQQLAMQQQQDAQQQAQRDEQRQQQRSEQRDEETRISQADDESEARRSFDRERAAGSEADSEAPRQERRLP